MMVSPNAFFSITRRFLRFDKKSQPFKESMGRLRVFGDRFTHCCRLSMFSRHAKSGLVRVIVSNLPKSTTWLLE